ncbi:hypothetical protein IQ268_09935 [Oculatella sp. LEGE 06141]|nr:hypothetical protein [Oculatella sp. LEGE 06141]MBE9178879.1 hypothetical protein [Oculatella sp. LEGE 06141]
MGRELRHLTQGDRFAKLSRGVVCLVWVQAISAEGDVLIAIAPLGDA